MLVRETVATTVADSQRWPRRTVGDAVKLQERDGAACLL